MIKPYIFILVFVSFSFVAKGSVIYTKQDSLIYESYIQHFANQQSKPINEIIVNTANYFLGKPYVASTLESDGEEQLIVNLREFDCTTFVENCIVLSRVIKSTDHSFSNYLRLLTEMRYREGYLDGYTSRLHYTSDWIYENQKSGILKDMSFDLDGSKQNKTIDFMSKHSHLYKHLKNNDINIKKLEKIEELINKRDTYCVISVEKVSTIENNIKNGDIIVFATSINGLDYSHIGIAYFMENGLHFIHASSQAKKIITEKKLLIDYCRDSKSCTGITVLRITNI